MADAPTGKVASAGARSGAGSEAADRPAFLVVGVGASKGVSVDEVLGLVEEVLRDAGLCVQSVAELATIDVRAEEPGILGAAERLGVPVVTYGAEELAGVAVPNPSDATAAVVGTPSVAEAAALLGGGELLVPKRKSAARPAMTTCAVVHRPGRGRFSTVAPTNSPASPPARGSTATVDMVTVVTVGSTAPRETADRTTPARGHRRQKEPE